MRAAPIVFALAVVGCGGSKPAPPADPPAAPRAKPVAVPRPAPSPLASPADAISFLPPNTDAILGVDIGALVAADILAPYRDKMLDAVSSKISKIRGDCGFDPMRDVDWIVAGFDGKGDHGVMVVRGAFTRATIERCIRAHDPESPIVDQGDIRIYGAGADAVFARWLGEGSVVFTSAEAGGAATLEESRGATDMAVINHASQVSSADVWFAANGALFGSTPTFGAVGIRASSRLSSDVTATLTVEFDKPGSATAAKQQIDAMLTQAPAMGGPGLGQIIQAIRVEVVGTELEAHVALTADDIKTIADLAKMF